MTPSLPPSLTHSLTETDRDMNGKRLTVVQRASGSAGCSSGIVKDTVVKETDHGLLLGQLRRGRGTKQEVMSANE